MVSTGDENHDNKIAAFCKKVEEIEKKHINVFKDEISKLTSRYPYMLTNYFFIEWYNNKYKLVFCTNVYIPAKVIEDLTEAFTDIFLPPTKPNL